ncbi:inovirus Gp2 family protein [Salmonella enterica]|uniref:Inovirus Gp2 family protein n=1 Tax=Salmonella enterica TaxID=28901 RepID=A0A5T8B9R1_SALER|nr:inovirus Gp2 family protein [Salmonella enterica]EBN4400465.1 inovirus Gp2 family protein [Salmonella enterica]
MFDSLLLDHRHGSLNSRYLEKIERVLQYALNEHPRTLAVRVDLRLSPQWYQNDSATCNPNLSSDLLTRFVCSVKSRIKHYRKKREREGERVHPCTPRYFWVKEIDTADFPHFHGVMFFNKDLFRGLGDFNSEENNLGNIIQQAWLSALDLRGCDEYKSLVHFPSNGVYTLDRNDPGFTRTWNNLMFRLSYLAKDETKAYSPKARSMGGSQK